MNLQEFVERVREMTPIAQVLREAGVEPRREGVRLRALCPLHPDRRPSLVVFPADGRGPERWKCFGCGQGGDVFTLLVALGRHRSRWEAIANRAQTLGIEPPPREGYVRREPSQVEELLRQAQRVYASAMTGDVLDYLRSRGFPAQFIRDQGVGYFPPGATDLFARTLDEGQRILTHKVGILRGGQDYFAAYGGGWIIFPNRRGNRVVDLQGRALPESAPKPKWLTRPGPIRCLWNEDALRSSRVLLCEGILDGLTAVLARYDAVAVYGQGGFKPDWVSRFARCREVYVCYDRDAMRRAVATAKLFDTRGRVVLLPPDLGHKGDLNDLLVRCGSPGRFRHVMDGLLSRAALPLEMEVAMVEVQPLATLRDRIQPLLREITQYPDPVVADHLTRMLAERCGLTLQVLRRIARGT